MRQMPQEDLERVASKRGIQLLLEFGSRVTGRTHPKSDVDLAVWLARPSLSLRELVDLQLELEALHPGVRDVDVAIINHADPLFLRRITEQCRLLYGSPRRLAELRMYAFRRYQDHRRYLPLEREYVHRTLARLAPA
jgi:predicted nucleotidyltransferase